MADPYIRFDRVTKSFGSHTVVDDLSLDIGRGEFLSLLGPSGSGKTTLLMMLAGFESVTSGSIRVEGRQIDALPPHRRNMGVVFQNYALFPHMSVAENVAFPLQMRGLSRSEIARKVGRSLDMVQLGAFRDRHPSQLSGGQQQRVALARALVFEPGVVLMDEPLGALDKKLREQMQLDIRALHRRLELTIVFVTHDQSEALTMSDRLAVINKGKVEQIGTPSEIYNQPLTRFVADFIGETNLIEGVVQSVNAATALVALAHGETITVKATGLTRPQERVIVSIRPERMELGRDSKAANTFSARIVDSVYHGDHFRIQLDAPANGCVAKVDRLRAEWAEGDAVKVSFAPSDCWVIAP